MNPRTQVHRHSSLEPYNGNHSTVSGWPQEHAGLQEHCEVGPGTTPVQRGAVCMELNIEPLTNSPAILSSRCLPQWRPMYVHMNNGLWTFTATLPLTLPLSATDTRNHVGDSPVCWANCKQPDERQQTDSTHTSLWKRQNHRGADRGEGRARLDHTETHERTLGGMTEFLVLDCNVITQLPVFVKTHELQTKKSKFYGVNKCKWTNEWMLLVTCYNPPVKVRTHI